MGPEHTTAAPHSAEGQAEESGGVPTAASEEEVARTVSISTQQREELTTPDQPKDEKQIHEEIPADPPAAEEQNPEQDADSSLSLEPPEEDDRSCLLGQVGDRLGPWILLALLMLAGMLFVSSVVFQAGEPGRETRYLLWTTQTVVSQSERALLSIAYPDELRVETSGEPRPISVWLWRETPTPGPSPTSTPSPTFTPTPAGSCTPVAADTPTATPTARPWIVAFEPHDDGILFTDREGVPVAPQVALTPGSESAAPAVLYAQRAPLATAAIPAQLSVSVRGPDGLTVGNGSLHIRLEGRKGAWWRHLKNVVFGPTTFLVTAAAALVAFVAQEWHRRSEREQRARSEKQADKQREIRYKVHALTQLKGQPENAVESYLECTELVRTDPDWQEVASDLDAAFEEAVSAEELTDLALTSFGNREDAQVSQYCEWILRRTRDHKAAQAFLDILAYLETGAGNGTTEEAAHGIVSAIMTVQALRKPGHQARADRLLEDLIELAQGHKWKKVYDLASEADRGSPWLELWPADLPAMAADLANWLDMVGLGFSPFGPQAGELDPRLREYAVHAVFDRARGPKPVLVFGEPGSGKTSAARLLAWYCLDQPDERWEWGAFSAWYAPPRELGTFPVWYAPPLSVALGDSRHTHLAAASRAIAHRVARHIARHAQEFLNLPARRKQGLVRLLSLWAGSAEGLVGRLRQAGPEWGTSSHLTREIQTLYQKISDKEMTEEDYLELLGGAKPDGFQWLCLLGDLPAGASRLDASGVESALQPLIDLAVPMASRRVHLKLFLPKKLRQYLHDLGGCAEVSLTWNEDQLREMAANRFRAAGGVSLGALGLPPDPDLDLALVEAAAGNPRQLVRAGNALLEAHLGRGGAPKLDTAWATQFLREWGKSND